MSNDRLLERIQKLLNLSASSNANEAAAAMAKAQELMREHALTELDVKAHMIGEARIKSTQSVSKPKDWEWALVHVVSSAFGCSVLFEPGHSRNEDYWARWCLIGDKSKVALAEYAVTVLLRQLVRERAAFSKSIRGVGGRKWTTMQLDGFAKGWVSTITAKVHEFANTPEIQQLIDARVQARASGKASLHKRGNGALGNHHGAEAAKNVELNRPMNQEERLALK